MRTIFFFSLLLGSATIIHSQKIEAVSTTVGDTVIIAKNDATSNPSNVGIYGKGYIGIIGKGLSVSGTGYGVYGVDDGQYTSGVYGVSHGSSGSGVAGFASGIYGFGIFGSSLNYHGGIFKGAGDTKADIVLGANNYVETDGVIMSDPNYGFSDMYLKSNDDVIINLDLNDDEDGEFDIDNSSQTIFKVTESGDLGMGVNTPEARVHINEPGTTDQQTIVQILSAHTSKRPILLFSESFSSVDLTDGMSIEYDGRGLEGENKLYFNKLGGTAMVTFKNNGNVGIGDINPDDALDVAGDIDATGCVQTDDSGSIGGTCLSDFRLKENIDPLHNQLRKILALNPSTFNWKANSSAKGSEIGLIAQEVEKIIPEMVTTDKNGYKRIKYDISLQLRIIKSIQEQQEIIESQQSEINDLKKELRELKSLLVRYSAGSNFKDNKNTRFGHPTN